MFYWDYNLKIDNHLNNYICADKNANNAGFEYTTSAKSMGECFSQCFPTFYAFNFNINSDLCGCHTQEQCEYVIYSGNETCTDGGTILGWAYYSDNPTEMYRTSECLCKLYLFLIPFKSCCVQMSTISDNASILPKIFVG